MQVVIGNMPEFEPKLIKHRSFQFSGFLAVCVCFARFCGEESSKHSNTKKLAMQYFEENVSVFYFKNTSKATLMSRKWKKSKFNNFYLKVYFFDKFP